MLKLASKKRLILGLAVILGLFSSSTYAGTAADEDSNKGKTAIITGSNRGMGLGWVEYFLSEGYTVVATARKPEKSTELNELKKKYKKQLYVEKLDVTSEEDHAALGEMLKKENIKIDIAISNAGVTVEEDFGSWTSKSWEMNYRVNTMGAAFFAQTLDPYLAKGSKLIQLSSGHGSIGAHGKPGNIDAYGVSKAGVNMLTSKLAKRWAEREIIVISITPGGVKTDMNPWGKLSVAEAIPIMYNTISTLTLEQSGTFITNKGKKMAW